MPDLKLIAAGPADIGLISPLAAVIWNQHYPSIISRQQIDYMLDRMYSAESLREQMEEKQHQFFLISNDDATIGFISVHREKDNNWFLNKFYIDQDIAAKGLGGKAFEALKQIIAPEKITLTVNRQNYKSINFYFKNGFKIDHVADFDIGNGYVMNDFVMVWKHSR